MFSLINAIEKRMEKIFPAKLIRVVKFGMVGVSGVFVNEGVLALLCFFFGKHHYQFWSIAAIELSIISNFLLNSNWTWGDRPAASGGGNIRRLLKFNTSAGLVAIVNWGTMVFLTRNHGIDPLVSNLIGIAFASAVNFLVSHFWTFRKHEA